MRTPLNGVIAALDILLRTTRADVRQHQFLEIAERSANMALEQINDVLEQARLDDRAAPEDPVASMLPPCSLIWRAGFCPWPRGWQSAEPVFAPLGCSLDQGTASGPDAGFAESGRECGQSSPAGERSAFRAP